jgi:hypothetical protein
MKMIMEKQMECRLAGETEVLGENLPQRHFCPSQNPTLPDAGLTPGRRGGKPATNRLSYGVALTYLVAWSISRSCYLMIQAFSASEMSYNFKFNFRYWTLFKTMTLKILFGFSVLLNNNTTNTVKRTKYTANRLTERLLYSAP